MKTFKTLFILLVLTFQTISAQNKEEQIITAISFEQNKIILNDQHAFNYKKEGNHFSILTLQNVEIISGDISSLGEGKFSNVILFIPQNKTFSNKNVIGRNQLIFKMSENNIITKDFKINEDKLNEFINKYNELK